MKDEKSKRIKNVKFMRRRFCFTYNTLRRCVYFPLWPCGDVGERWHGRGRGVGTGGKRAGRTTE